MNLNPKSPFSNRHLSDLTDEHVREGDAWCAQLLGWWSVTPNIDSDDWTGCHPANTVDQNIRNYHSDWAAAGPLMERPEMYLELFGALRVNAIEHMESTRSHYKRRHLQPVNVRNHFIVAATHAAIIAAGKE